MSESQLTPINLYYHSKKQEWRARYVELEAKKAKYFSCKRYGYNRAYFLSSLYLRVIKDRQNIMSNSDLSFWHSVIKDFKSLEEVPQKVLARPPTRTSNLNLTVGTLRKIYPGLDEKWKFLEHGNQELFNKTVSDIESKVYLTNATFPIPQLCLTSLRNEGSNLINLLKRYKFELEKSEERKERGGKGGVSLLNRDREEKSMSVYEILESLVKYESRSKRKKRKGSEEKGKKDEVEDKTLKEEKQGSKKGKVTKESKLEKDNKLKKEERKRKRSEFTEDLISIIKMNKKSCGEVAKQLNSFILKSANTLDSYNFLKGISRVELTKVDPRDLEEEREELQEQGGDNEEGETSEELVEMGEDEVENFIKLCQENEDIIEQMGKDFEEEKYYQGNKETFINTFSKLLEENNEYEEEGGEDDEPETLKEFDKNFKANTVYDQVIIPSSYIKGMKDSYGEEERPEKNLELVKVCNDKLSSLIKEIEKEDEENQREMLYRSLEQESKSSSDLMSLIRISNRINKENKSHFKSNRMYYMNGEYEDKYIDVVYKNGKIIPQSTIQFFTKSKNKIVLSGNEKVDVNMEALEKIFNKNYCQNETIKTILENLQKIDEKLIKIVQEYDCMQMALNKYMNWKERDPESTNQIEEVVNLETLHFVTESLLETKLRMIQQVHSYFESQLNLLETVIPTKYFKMFNQILYHKFNEF